MKDLAIVYVSKYGHAKQYADWLKESFDADVITAASFNPTKFLAYKATVFISGVYSDKIQIMEWFKKNSTGINPTKMIIAAVSWYTNDSEEGKDKLIKENFPDNFKNVVPLVVINSGIDKKQISAVEKARLAAASAAINKHDVRSTDDINALAIIKGYSDQTSKDNLASLIKAINKVLHPAKAPAKHTEAPKSAATPAAAVKTPEPVKAAAEVQKAEVPKQEAPVQSAPRQEAPKQEAPRPKSVQNTSSTISSVDDALAALSSGNILLNRPPVHSAKTEEAPVKAAEEPSEPEVYKADEVQTPEPAPKESNIYEGIEIPEVPTLAQAVHKAEENVVHEEAAPKESNLYEGIEIPEVPTLAQAVHKAEEATVPEEKPAPKESNIYEGIEIPEVPTLAQAMHKAEENVVREEPAPKESTLYEGIEIPEVPTLAQAVHKAEENVVREEAAPKEETKEFVPESDETVLSLSDDIEEINKALETPVQPVQEAPRSEPVTFKRPEPVPVKKPERTSTQKNSYLEFFSRKSNTPKSEPEPEPVKAETPAPAPAPAPAPVQDTHAIDDFDFDILGNESSTAGKVSARALNAVEAHAKAKAAAEAEKSGVKPADTGVSSVSNTYDTVSNSLDENIASKAEAAEVVPEAAPVQSVIKEEAAVKAEQPSENAETVQTAKEEEAPYDDSFDDVMFSNDADYDLDDIDVTKLLEPEPAPKSENKRLDFKKLQEEIEASIEENKKIRDKEKYRNMRESERRAAEEELANPKKGIKQPDDPDIFFKRPGKDYYASDSMPEIRFNRRKQG